MIAPIGSLGPELITDQTDFYYGQKEADGTYAIFRPDGQPLDPARSLAVRNHSPTGFSWGYRGSGPAQAALAILLDFSNDEGVALQHYQQFKEEVVAKLAPDAWVLPANAITDWLNNL